MIFKAKKIIESFINSYFLLNKSYKKLEFSMLESKSKFLLILYFESFLKMLSFGYRSIIFCLVITFADFLPVVKSFLLIKVKNYLKVFYIPFLLKNVLLGSVCISIFMK